MTAALTAAFIGIITLGAQAQGLTTPPSPMSADRIVALAEMVVSASRSERDISNTSSSVTLLPVESFRESGVHHLESALAAQPGVMIANSGALGSQSSVFLRGASSHQTLFVVDGVRMNDRSALYQNFLGGAGLENIARLEVLRGQQSTLYGSSAMGGVITLNTAGGRPGFSGRLDAEAGSFGTYRGSAFVSGKTDTLGYTAGLSRLVTDNDRPGNTFKSWEYSGRVDFAATETLTIGVTVRGQKSDYEEPGSTLFPSPGEIDTKNLLATGYAEWRSGDAVTSRITAGVHRRDYEFATQWGISTNEDRRDVFDWTTEWNAGAQIEIVGGVNFERSKHIISGDETRDETLAAFASGTVDVNEALTVTLGGRNDHFDTVGGAATWRVGASWQVAELTRLRATYGTGFAAPSAEDRYGVPAWGQLANPGLEPEKSRGWDVGVEQDFDFAGITASATYFKNKYENLFEWETVDFNTFEGMIVNRDRASTSGVELAVEAHPHIAVSTRVSYTHLRAKNDVTGDDLIRRPEHTLDAELSVLATRQLRAGAGLRFISNRVDTTGPLHDYVTVRLFGRMRMTEDLVLTARLENVLDEAYEEVAGYPALPFGAYAGVEWRF